MQIDQNITPFFSLAFACSCRFSKSHRFSKCEKLTGRICMICSERFNQKSLGMKYLILMAARHDDKGIEEKMELEI